MVDQEIKKFGSGCSVEHRYVSYDFCYLYFQRNKGFLGNVNMENSCMHLWSYLASWGMLRGSSVLLQRSPACLKELVAYFDSICHSVVWDVDVDSYASHKSEILQVYNDISQIMERIMNHNESNIPPKITKPSPTLITKIMLGVFGCVPALDQYFCKTFRGLYGGFYELGSKELDRIGSFYEQEQHKELIDSIRIPVLDFDGKKTELYYKKAKLIDMYGFVHGQELSKNNSTNL